MNSDALHGINGICIVISKCIKQDVLPLTVLSATLLAAAKLLVIFIPNDGRHLHQIICHSTRFIALHRMSSPAPL